MKKVESLNRLIDSYYKFVIGRNKKKNMRSKTIEEHILSFVARLSTPGFFITVEFSKSGKEMPHNLEAFLFDKLTLIRNGINGRKFVFREGEWRMIITYFPTDRAVDEKYALKNKVTR